MSLSQFFCVVDSIVKLECLGVGIGCASEYCSCVTLWFAGELQHNILRDSREGWQDCCWHLCQSDEGTGESDASVESSYLKVRT